MQARRLSISVLLIALTIVVGAAFRFARLGLPSFAVKYGGSALWALMIYWIVSTVCSSWRILPVFFVSGSIATAVEFFKLYHSPALDAFRLTLPGILLLGRFFSWWDILAYWIAIACGGWIDRSIRSKSA
jgi:hypothetical protein